MRRKAKRDLVVLGGVAVVLAGIVLANNTFQRGDLTRRMTTLRLGLEKARAAEGIKTLNWGIVRETEGSFRKGATFDERLIEKEGTQINVIGFMVAYDQFRNVSEFMLLPLPIECYFCQIPPARDIMMVRLEEGETTNFYSDPVMVNGTLVLNKGEGVKSFYLVDNAILDSAEKGKELQVRRFKKEHMAPAHTQTTVLEPGIEPPTGADIQ